MAALLREVDLDLAQAGAVAAFTQAKAAVAAASGGQPAPAQAAPVDPALVKAANTVLAANAGKAVAQHGFDVARSRLGELATALYLHEVATPEVAAAEAANGYVVDASILVGILLSQERAQFNSATRALDAAARQADHARSSADQLVAAKAATLVSQAQRAGAVPAATTATAAPPATTATAGPPRASATPTTQPGRLVASRYPSPTILGTAVLTAPELAGWYAGTGHQAQLTVPMATLAGFYQSVGAALGVRDDIAFAQSVLETGSFTFPAGGQLGPSDNNFAGIGACDSCAHGWQFANAQTGVAAQLQLLHDYASTQPVPGPLTGQVGVSGCCQTWMALSGVWATAQDYGYNILNLYRQMLEWALPRRKASVGL